MLWAARLGSLLVYRVVRTGGDSRFEAALKSPPLYLVYWLMQAVWVWVTLSATLWLNGSDGANIPGFWGSDVVGAVLFAAGFLTETVADAQKLVWKLDPANKGIQDGEREERERREADRFFVFLNTHPPLFLSSGRWIDTGLWSLARYPNYAGEMTLWWGVWLLAAPSFGRTGAWATVAGPLFVALLLLRVSGIPLQEEQARARWGDDAGYKAYVRRTRLLVPVPK